MALNASVATFAVGEDDIILMTRPPYVSMTITPTLETIIDQDIAGNQVHQQTNSPQP